MEAKKKIFEEIRSQLKKGDLEYVIDRLKRYLSRIEIDPHWSERLNKASDNLNQIKSNLEVYHIKEIIKEEVKEELNTIISAFERNNGFSEDELPDKNVGNKSIEENFEGTMGSLSIKTTGKKAWIGAIVFFILVVLLIFFSTNNKIPNPIPFITNCDCTKIENIETIVQDELKNRESRITTLTSEKKDTTLSIENKTEILAQITIISGEVDSIKNLTPRINTLKKKCPYINCNDEIKKIEQTIKL